MNSLEKRLRFEQAVEPNYRAFMNQLGRAGQIERVGRMSQRLALVDHQRHVRQFSDFPNVGLPVGPLSSA